MPGQHFDLVALGIDPAASDECVRILKDGKRWAYVVDPDIVGPPKVLAHLCIDLMKKGAKIYAKQQGRHEAEVLMEILVSLDHYLQETDERSH